MMRLLRGLTGLAVLAALAVGLPWALAATIGNPLDSWGPITAGQMGDREVMAVMAAVAYAAWASFAIALVVELIAAVAAKGSKHRRTLRLPLLGLQQNVARSLITAVLLLLPTALTVAGPTVSALAEPSRPAATASASPAPSGTQQELPPQAGVPVSAAPPAAATAAAAPMYVIPDSGGLRSYWAIAEQYLGDGQRWQEIWQLNDGRIQDDGSVMDTPRQLHRGWTVALPGDAGGPVELGSLAQGGMHDVLVEPGDTLSGLAEEAGATDWTAIWPANANRAETGGEQLSDPDLIKPGWTISVPTDPAAIPRTTLVTAAPPVTVEQPATPPVTVEQPGPVADPQEGTVAAPVPLPTSAPTDLPTPAPTTAPATAPTTAATPSGVPVQRTSTEVADAGSGSAVIVLAEWSASLAAGAGLLAGSALLAMRRYRRRQFRNRDAGRAVRGPAPQHVPLEKALITAGSAVRDVDFIDRALRALAGGISDAHGRLPAVVAARLTEHSLDLVLADAQDDAPPPPWVAVSPTSWVVAKDSELTVDPDTAAPYPTLISLGHTPAGEEWLVDLEQAGAVTLDGDPDRCLDLMRFAIAELAHNVWADHLTVTLAGFGEELVDLNPARLVHSGDIAAAARIAANDVAALRDLEGDVGVDVLHGRLEAISGDAWMPSVLIVAPGWAAEETDAEAVRTLMGSLSDQPSRTAVAVILPGDEATGRPSDGLLVRVLEDGTLLIPSLDVIAAAQQLPADQAVELAAYMAAARDVESDALMPAADDDEALSDLAGALLPERVAARPDADERLVRTGSDDDATSILPLPASAYMASTATTADDVHTLAPAVPATTRDAVQACDPDLDADLAAWHEGNPARPRLQLLGEISLTASGSVPDGKAAIVTEAIAYLALHPRGVTGDRFAADFWPDSQYTIRDSNPKNTLSLARTRLGANPATGEPCLPYARSAGRASGSAPYRVDGLLVDADLFRRLRTRAATRGPAGHDDLVSALQLVQGCPLSGLRPGGGSWLADGGIADADTLLVAIVEVAHLVATRALAEGDIEQARWAAQTAIDTGAADDRPLLDLAAAYDAEGREAELAAAVRRVRDHHDAEVEEDIPARTYDVLLRKGWLNLSEAS